jgi:hypothetical protein
MINGRIFVKVTHTSSIKESMPASSLSHYISLAQHSTIKLFTNSAAFYSVGKILVPLSFIFI